MLFSALHDDALPAAASNEIGSGHSSAVMLDTNEFSLNNSIDFTFIEPFPENRLLKILNPTDHERTRILKSFTQMWIQPVHFTGGK
jgi:hypothetical protein